MENSWAWLIITGGALEAVGIMLVAWDLRNVGRAVRRFGKIGDAAQLSQEIEVGFAEFEGEKKLYYREGLSAKAKAKAYRESVAEYRAKRQELMEILDRRIKPFVEGDAGGIEGLAAWRDRALANLLLDITEGRLLRVISVVLLLLGVAATSVGSILSLG